MPRFRLVALSVLLVASTAASLSAGDPKDDGFRPLFNGRDLTGWTYDNRQLNGLTETPDKRFRVIDGTIVAAEGKGIKVLNTAEAFEGDIHLKLDFRAAERADSGVYVRGPQLQVRDFLRRKEQPALQQAFKTDGWNELEVRVSGDQLMTFNNGKPLKKTDVLELTVKDGQHVAKLNGKELEITSLVTLRGVTECKINGTAFDHNYRAGAKGPIGLQAETGQFEFRNVRIKTK